MYQSKRKIKLNKKYKKREKKVNRQPKKHIIWGWRVKITVMIDIVECLYTLSHCIDAAKTTNRKNFLKK